MRRAAAAAALAGALAALGGCGSGGAGTNRSATATATTTTTTTAPPTTDRRRPPSGPAIVAAMAALPKGGLRIGELTTGVVRDLDAAARPVGPVLARVPVSTGGQRGLLGLAVVPGGPTYAAYTERGGRRRLVVAQILPGPVRRVWTGPPSTDLADGGHLALVGVRLVVGVGDLQDPARTPEDAAPNGKLLSLDPAGPPSQRPRILSRGWNNPYAFTPYPGTGGPGVLVADNAPGTRPERIARGDAGGGTPQDVTNLPRRIAPSGLALVTPTEVAVCGVRSGRLARFRRHGGRWTAAGTLASCAFGVTALTDGRLAVSTATGVRTVRP